MSYDQRRKFLWVVFLAGLMLIALVANATTLAHLPFEQMARQATAVGRMRCLSAESQWYNGEIWTVTRFAVVEREKGLLAGIITVRMMGGTSGSLHSHVDGVPVFRPGEEVYLFLWGTAGAEYSVLGWSQGTFRIRQDKRAGTEVVTQDSADLPVFDWRVRSFVHNGIRKLPVAAFQEKLKRALESQR